MQRRRASVRLALVAALASSPAAAQTLSNAAAPWGNAPPPPPLSPAPAFVEPLPKPPMESYAAASWAVFGGSVALTATYAFSNGLTVVPGTLGLTGLVFGGPIVHWVNGRVGHGFVVLGVNLAASAVGFGLGLGIACSSRCGGGDFGALGALFVGFIGGGVGLLTANVVNAAAFSERPVPPRRHGVAFAPLIDAGPGRLALGVGGVF